VTDPAQAPAAQSTASRRQFLKGAASGLAGLAVSGPLLSACGGGPSGATAPGTPTIKVGFVSPRTGSTAGFGEPDGYVLGLARAALTEGLQVGGTTYAVEILDRDSQSNPQTAAQVANDLINSDRVDLMLATSTPETVNAVSDACEAAGMPCISTNTPWEAWYFGRGAKPGQPSPFKWTYHFSFGVDQFANSFISMWPQVPTNKKVGVMWPDDADGRAIRASLGPLLRNAGYTIVDPGPYIDGTNDFSAQISQFKSENCEIFNTFPIPPDFATFWQQAAKLEYRPRIAQIAKTGLFLSQVQALGPIGVNLASAVYWGPTFPYYSSLTGISSQQLGDGYQAASGKLWNQNLGATMSLLDVGMAALKATPNPRDKTALIRAVTKLRVDTMYGRVAWGTGPVPNVVTTPIIGG